MSWTAQKIDKKINPTRTPHPGFGSYSNVNKFDPPHPGGTHPTQGGFRVSKIQKPGKCHELPRKSIKKITLHPTRGGGWSFRGKN